MENDRPLTLADLKSIVSFSGNGVGQTLAEPYDIGIVLIKVADADAAVALSDLLNDSSIADLPELRRFMDRHCLTVPRVELEKDKTEMRIYVLDWSAVKASDIENAVENCENSYDSESTQEC